ncbi:MAG: hypothetical protein QOJ45_1254 [Verrucomicrobiota bacterium]|jgi:hypothetical protein
MIAATGFLAGCSATTPPPLSANNPANSQVRAPMNTPHNVLAHDETTLAIQEELTLLKKEEVPPK